MPNSVKMYHKTLGETETFTINAREAVRNHPDEWSMNPWPETKSAKTASSGNSAVGLEAVHRGRGSFSIMRGDQEIREKLSKEEAEAFNALPDEQKEAFVAGPGSDAPTS